MRPQSPQQCTVSFAIVFDSMPWPHAGHRLARSARRAIPCSRVPRTSLVIQQSTSTNGAEMIRKSGTIGMMKTNANAVKKATMKPPNAANLKASATALAMR